MIQYDLFNKLPIEIIELQNEWINAIERRVSSSRGNIYEMYDDEPWARFLCSKYLKARKLEMEIFDMLCDKGKHFSTFQGCENYLHI